jgi:hypothetical protein
MSTFVSRLGAHSQAKSTGQICVLQDDEVALHQAIDCCESSLFWLFPASMPLMAGVIHSLAERDHLRLDEFAATYWPKVAAVRRTGKHAQTISPLHTPGDFVCAAWKVGCHYPSCVTALVRAP